MQSDTPLIWEINGCILNYLLNIINQWIMDEIHKLLLMFVMRCILKGTEKNQTYKNVNILYKNQN